MDLGSYLATAAVLAAVMMLAIPRRRVVTAAAIARRRYVLRQRLKETLGSHQAERLVREVAERLRLPESDLAVLTESAALASGKRRLHEPPLAGSTGRRVGAMVLCAALACGIPDSARAYQVLEGEKRLACETLLCLASGQKPHQCTKALQHYFSIKAKRPWKTFQLRQDFLSLCPKKGDSEGTAEARGRVGEGATPDDELAPEQKEAVLTSLLEQRARVEAELQTRERVLGDCKAWKGQDECGQEADAVARSKEQLEPIVERIGRLRSGGGG